VNYPPVAQDQSVTTAENAAVSIALTATDPDGDGLTYSITTPPAHGTLSGTAPNLTYTPAPYYNGSDSFTFKANDGQADSAAATVSITVTPVNYPPVAVDDAAATTQGVPVDVAVLANDSDPDGDPLSVTAATAGSYGTTRINADGTVTYTPETGFAGTDAFTYTITDGRGGFDTATVIVTVRAANHPPVANGQSVTTAEDAAANITLTATDPDGDALTYSVVTPPAHGALSGTAPNLTYTPALYYNGPDSFTFKANDGLADSDPATVSITVTPVNYPPQANNQSVTTAENTAVNVTLTATDPDRDPLTYSVATPPAHGTLTGTAPNLTYTPALYYNGPDSFTFTANDGQAVSAAATVSITVTPVNYPPQANGQSVTTAENAAAIVTLTATDPDGDPLTYSVVTPPAHGTLTGTAPNLTYTPASYYNGSDSFTFRANDGQASSNVATVSITVTPVNYPPVAKNDTATTPQNKAVTIPVLANDTDPDGDTLSVSAVTQGANGTVATNGTTATYTPNPGFYGTDSFTYTAADGHGGTASAKATVTVTASALPDIYGRITNSTGIGGITVTLTKKSGSKWVAAGTTTTNAQGYYTFSRLALATYRVTPSSTSWTFTPTYRQITISSSSNHVLASFTATPK